MTAESICTDRHAVVADKAIARFLSDHSCCGVDRLHATVSNNGLVVVTCDHETSSYLWIVTTDDGDDYVRIIK